MAIHIIITRFQQFDYDAFKWFNLCSFCWEFLDLLGLWVYNFQQIWTFLLVFLPLYFMSSSLVLVSFPLGLQLQVYEILIKVAGVFQCFFFLSLCFMLVYFFCSIFKFTYLFWHFIFFNL